MKQRKHWLVGAVIGFCLSIFLWIAYIVYIQHYDSTAVSYLSEKIFRHLYFVSVVGWRNLLLMFPDFAKIEFFVFPSISLTLYGSVIGWIYGKFKNKS